MRINNIIAKITSKIKMFFLKYFGNNKKADRIIKLFMAILSASAFYYYIADLGLGNILSYIIMTVIFYIVFSIVIFMLKYIYEAVRRLRPLNVILFVILNIILYKIFDECASDANLSDIYVYALTLITSTVIFIFSKSFISFTKNRKKAALPFLVISIPVIAFSVMFLIWPGESHKSALKYVHLGPKEIDPPAAFGSKVVEYGNDDKNTISLLNYVNYSGNTKKIRDMYFGKSLAKVPIKGRVWYPQNKEKSPVLFIVHGNHRFTEENYKGYDYLGRYLARRGYVVVSVDMNMLNGFMKYGLGGENDARAVLLLENIKEVLKLNENRNSLLYNLIDKDNIAIAGHSRGGEAVAIAESYNRLKYNPDNGDDYNYNFNIKGVISISPTVDQYNPSNKPVKMENVNYLVLHGTNDKDVTGFQGMKLYNNTEFTEDSNNFKCAVYIGYANHGQFNERWRSYDSDPPVGYFINRKALLKESDQEMILCKYSYEFLENTFGLSNDRGLFKNPQEYNLPKTLYYSRYQDSSFKNLVDFEDDYDLTTVKGGKAEFNNYSKLTEEELVIGGFGTGNTALIFSNGNMGSYKIKFDNTYDAKNYLQFDIKSMDREENYKRPNIKVELLDKYGNVSGVNLIDDFDDFSHLFIYPNIKVELSKLQMINNDYKYKGSLQTVRIPIDYFITKSKLVRTDIKGINFVFENNDSSSVIIDNIGFSN